MLQVSGVCIGAASLSSVCCPVGFNRSDVGRSVASGLSDHERELDQYVAKIMDICELRDAASSPVGRCAAPIADRGLDQRRGTCAAVFRLFIERVQSADAYSYDSLSHEGMRVPLAVNTGVAGSGKTFHLWLLQYMFEYYGFIDAPLHNQKVGFFALADEPQPDSLLARALYAPPCAQAADLKICKFSRAACRIIHAAAVRAQTAARKPPFDYVHFWQRMQAEMCDDPRRFEAPEICRRLLRVPNTAPLLILLDEEPRTLVAPPSVRSDECFDLLRALGSIAQRHGIARARQRENKELCDGPLFLVLSAQGAIDTYRYKKWAARPVCLLPLPPLDLSRGFDSEAARIVCAKHDKSSAKAALIALRALMRLLHGNPGGPIAPRRSPASTLTGCCKSLSKTCNPRWSGSFLRAMPFQAQPCC